MEQIKGEKSVVWLVENFDDIDYVRERQTECPTRRAGPISKNIHRGARLIGYTELEPNWPKEQGAAGFKRRIFWLRPWDRKYGPGAENLTYLTGSPLEGIDPRSVFPNVAGVKTDKSENALEGEE